MVVAICASVWSELNSVSKRECDSFGEMHEDRSCADDVLVCREGHGTGWRGEEQKAGIEKGKWEEGPK